MKTTTFVFRFVRKWSQPHNDEYLTCEVETFPPCRSDPMAAALKKLTAVRHWWLRSGNELRGLSVSLWAYENRILYSGLVSPGSLCHAKCFAPATLIRLTFRPTTFLAIHIRKVNNTFCCWSFLRILCLGNPLCYFV